MKDFLLYTLAAFLLISLQAVLFKVVKPDLLLVLVCLYSLRYGGAKSVAFGSAAGLMADSASGFLIGPHIISMLSASVVMNFLREKLFKWNSFIFVVVVTCVTAADIIFIYIYTKTFSTISPVDILSGAFMLEVIYTAAAAFVFYRVMMPDTDFIQQESSYTKNLYWKS
ncbi:MAG: hypothetical protein Q7U10_10955 [Thermodesulfovibrionia bacterium]|nr:hypothetical protein [Thermodesulfovibrionia bacterium]